MRRRAILKRAISMRATIMLGCAIACLGGTLSNAADRVALVIGNSKYAGDAALRNPSNDADLLEAALLGLDFSVTKKKDLTLEQMEDALVDFQKKLPKGGLGLFYYAGHGVQVNGENFLVPIGARIRVEAEVKRQCLPADQVLDMMAESDTNLKVLILDCCRNNPFKRSWKRSLEDNGLAQMNEAPEGTIIAYSTAPKKAADDGDGRNSPYAEKLASALKSRPAEGLEIGEAFRETSRAVKQATGQVGWLSGEASLDKYFLRPASSRQPAAQTPSPLPKTLEINLGDAIKMQFVQIPPGEFDMGSPAQEEGRYADEDLEHKKIDRIFFLGRYEVTQQEYKAVMGTNPSRFTSVAGEQAATGNADANQLPVESVSWTEAVEFCRQLNALPGEHAAGRNYRLPTSSEWEYACRAGTLTMFSFAGNLKLLQDFAWYDKNGQSRTHPVGTKKPNPWGLFDMHGNVREWCQDKNTSENQLQRIVRSGSWASPWKSTRSAAQWWAAPGTREDDIGFRVVLELNTSK
jgi:formylglycine-generating enzyme required for sulfatase activity